METVQLIILNIFKFTQLSSTFYHVACKLADEIISIKLKIADKQNVNQLAPEIQPLYTHTLKKYTHS